jgi:hypothetical protein
MNTTTYSDSGITTAREAHFLLGVMFVVGISVAVLYAVRTDEYVRAASVAVWMIAVAVGTVRALREVVALPPDRATKLAFQLAAMQPILGIVPLMLFLLP